MPFKQLEFFNKQGDNINIRYNSNTKLFEGDLLFDENSTDTFKTYALYTLEKIDSFDFEDNGNIGTNKFQLFNEYGLNFYGTKTTIEKITGIEPVNNDPTFYSKWVYGINFETKFPIGSIICFNDQVYEFTDKNKSYIIIGSKKNAIMIISSVDNATFESNFYNDYSNFNKEIYIQSKNAIGIYNYINERYINNISYWSEPNFYDKIYDGKRINVVNTTYNDGVYTINNSNLTDTLNFRYSANIKNFPLNKSLIIEVLLKSDVPKLYDGSINITSDNRLFLNNANITDIYTNNQTIKIIGSVDNTNFLTLSKIYDYENSNKITYYNLYDQVIYKGKIYECIMPYTHNHSDDLSKFITPFDTEYWIISNHLKVNETTIEENILNGQIYLTTNKFYYEYQWDTNKKITLLSAVDKYKTTLKQFNIDLYYDNNFIIADLLYPSDYATVNFYHSEVNEYNLITLKDKTFERLIEVKETIKSEFNYNISENFKNNIVFTDIDQYGIKITINKKVYQEEVAFVYNGLSIDKKRTIDKTLRNWLVRYYNELLLIGIETELDYTGDYTSSYYNSIVIKTTYPNVDLIINEINVGTTGDFYIEHSRVIFNKIGPNFSININGFDYSTSSILTSEIGKYDINNTISKWYNTFYTLLQEKNIFIVHINNMLKFNIKDTNKYLSYTINDGNTPGSDNYKIINKKTGNVGCLLSSNEVILSASSSNSFEDKGFATGMVISLNNTNYPYVNQEYNIEYLQPDVLNLSYQGPFWDVNNFKCIDSPFVTLAFSLGFGQNDCIDSGLNGTSGMFNSEMFSNVEYYLNYNPNSYTLYDYTTIQNNKDIIYVQLSNSLYVFGTNIQVVDSFNGNDITTIELPNNIDSIKILFNTIDNYLYCLSKNHLFTVDPLTNILISTKELDYDAVDISINTTNGDVYISYSNYTSISIINLLNDTYFNLGYVSYKMCYNEYNNSLYVITNNKLLKIDLATSTIDIEFDIINIQSDFIFLEPLNNNILVYNNTNLLVIDKTDTITTTIIDKKDFQDIVSSPINGDLFISNSDNELLRVDIDFNVLNTYSVSNYGYLAANPFDGGIYISSQYTNCIEVFDILTSGTILNAAGFRTTKIIYNPDRKSVWTIQPETDNIIEIKVQVNSIIEITPITSELLEDNKYGTLHNDYVPKTDIWIKTRDYYRKPRENFEGDVKVKYYWKWFSNNVPEFFLYDFSGDQLPTGTSYSYIGEKPLSNIVLNRTSNTDITKINQSEYQQTIFDKIVNELSYIDDSVDISSNVEPLQLFIGFNSSNEGSLRSILQLYKQEDIKLNLQTDIDDYITLETLDIDNDNKRGIIYLNENSNYTFTNKGLKPEQHIVIYIKDNINTKNQYISDNNASIFIIREVYTKSIIVDFFNKETDILEFETIRNLNFKLEVIDKEIGRFYTYAQTEEEDIRFKTELGNVGKLINPDDVFIFKQYDISEGGIDWCFLNKKRKEMLMMKHLIYPYIGSYKSIINAINFFGYNDLKLNEYYKDVDVNSINFSKLFKVEIPDIFDNTVEGWTENDFLKNLLPSENFEGTNLFNLTYDITDKEGNNILEYSIDEVIIKLQGLKNWLKKNIIPLTHKILDITGTAYFNSGFQITHKINSATIFNMSENLTPITSKLNEAYLLPINSGSTVYNCVLDFYSIIPNIGSDKTKNGLVKEIRPYYDSILIQPDYFNIKIRTYKTYKEWNPFVVYSKNDKIIYYGKLYESMIDGNKVNNPNKYENVDLWDSTFKYFQTNIVKYKQDVFTCINDVYSDISPLVDTENWLKITQWKEIDFTPVQTINEFREGDNLLPFNFTIDSNLDPFITIEVTSDNGYGSIFSDKKNYELRGTKDLSETVLKYDKLGPFEVLIWPNSSLYE